MRPSIAVFHHPWSFSPLDIFQRVNATADIIWLVDDDGGTAATTKRVLSRLGRVVDASEGPHKTAEALRGFAPAGIVSFVDFQLQATAAIAAYLDLPYHSPEVAATLADKRLQRAALDKAGVPGPSYWLVPEALSEDDIAALAAKASYPAVLKPAHGSGGAGVQLVNSQQELAALLRGPGAGRAYLLEALMGDGPSQRSWLSSELVVESVVNGGKTSHITVDGRFPLAPPFRQTGSFLPYSLPQAVSEEVLQLTSAAIETLGIMHGIVHTEVKLTPGGAKLVEVNGRLGGIVPFILERASDINLFEVACQAAMGSPVTFEHLADCRGVAFWYRFLPPVSAQRVVAIEGADSLAQLPGVDSAVVNSGPGDAVDWRHGTTSLVATVRGCVPDMAALESTIGLLQQRLQITYE